MGASPMKTLLKVDLPIMNKSLIAAGLIIFVDIVKELPITLMLRPFNFETLSIRSYQLASDERLEEASICAIGIVLASLTAVIILTRILEYNKLRGYK